MLSLLVVARASRAQSPDSENGTLRAGGPVVARSQAARASFAYYEGSRCTGTVGTLVPTIATGATGGTFSASPGGLRLDPATGSIDLAQSQPGTYTIVNQLAEAVAASTTLELHALPSPVLTASGATALAPGGSVQLVASGGQPGASYQFFNDGQAISGATTSTYTATAGGSYTVLVINPGSCVAASAPVAITAAPARATRAAAASPVTLQVFPNPNTGSFVVAISGSAASAELAVFTSGGQPVQTLVLPLIAGSAKADLSKLAPGTYLLRATTAGGTVTRRVVRE
ncbi:T9SS type A sorting domain-containing protein [Hymenobacter aquaticus]|uniref:T9SS type A sorting domain-containing protein n=1 Tax=Hymenobacter aquaticus TaxID=1867101 RepID=A0A4Z0Q729_9BACT|nr:T9SS type A sorting domain-containing protein [Hymenobacter aquaticus]TGE25266.1 T9SS type A sorting domain-containing protein [Hymenobacter aquaticus]